MKYSLFLASETIDKQKKVRMVQASSSTPSSSNLSRAAFVAPVRLESALELALLYTPGEVNRP